MEQAHLSHDFSHHYLQSESQLFPNDLDKQWNKRDYTYITFTNIAPAHLHISTISDVLTFPIFTKAFLTVVIVSIRTVLGNTSVKPVVISDEVKSKKDVKESLA